MTVQWRVLYKDGTIEEGYDNLSKQAYNNSNIVYFSLFINNSRYSVNLEDGTITLNHVDIKSPFSDAKYRLIYYRVRSQTLPNENVESYEVPYIGWQTTLNNKNYKLIYGITSENEITIVME